MAKLLLDLFVGDDERDKENALIDLTADLPLVKSFYTGIKSNVTTHQAMFLGSKEDLFCVLLHFQGIKHGDYDMLAALAHNIEDDAMRLPVSHDIELLSPRH